MIDRSCPPRLSAPAVSALPEPEVRVMDNGATLAVFGGSDRPTCTLRVMFDGGASELGSVPLQNLLSSQITEGTLSKSADEVADILDRNGARHSPADSYHHTGFRLAMLNRRASEVMELMSEIYAAPAFEPRLLAAAQMRAEARLRHARSTMPVLASEAIAPLIFGKSHPRSVPASSQQIAAVSPDALRAAHSRLCTAAGCYALLAGDVTTEVREAVEGFLNSLPAKQPEPIVVLPYEPDKAQTVRVERPEAVQCAVSAAIPAPLRSHPDYLPLRIAVMALGGYFGSRLNVDIRERRGLTYGIGSALFGERDGSYISISAQCSAASVDALIDAVRNELLRLRTEPPCGAELERLRRHAATDALETLDTPEAVASYYASMRIAAFPDAYFDTQQRIVASIGPDDIAEMAGRYLDPDALRIAVAGPAE